MAAIPPGTDLSQVPLMPNPDGSPPNFNNPDSLGPTILGLGLFLAVVSTALVSTRLVTNFKISRRLHVDDYFCAAAQILMIAYWAVILSLGFVAARHSWDFPLSTIDASFTKRQFVQELIIGPALWFPKAAVLVLYVRLFGAKQWLRWTSWAVIAVTGLVYWACVPLTGVFCYPDPSKPPLESFSACVNVAWQAAMQGSVAVAADLLIFILPLPVLMKLQLSPAKKKGMMFVFAMGFFAFVASVVSLYFRVVVYAGSDPLWNGARVVITTICEGFVTIMVSCAPATSAFWTGIFTQSRLYYTLRSVHLFSHGASQGEQSAPNTKADHTSTENTLRGSEEGNCPKTWGRHQEAHISCTASVQPPPKARLGSSRDITMSTAIDQSSEKSQKSLV